MKPVKDTVCRDWMVTLYAENTDLAAAKTVFVNTFEAGVYQIEEGHDTGTRHLQGFGQFTTPRRFSTVVNALSVPGVKAPHVERRLSSVGDCVAYCSKDDTRVEEPVFFGGIDYRDHQGARHDLVDLRDQILSGKTVDDVLLDDDEGKAARFPRYLHELHSAVYRQRFGTALRQVRVTVVTGQPGTGKTLWAFENFGGSMNRVTDYMRDPFGAYDPSRQTLVLDEFKGQIPIELLLSICDVYPGELPARYNNKQMTHERVAILSSFRVHEWYRLLPAEQLAALRRRIHEEYVMTSDHKLIEVS
jgi:hypothetical protein